MPYTAQKNTSGNYEVMQDGNRVATGSEGILGQYGLNAQSLAAPPTVNPNPQQAMGGSAQPVAPAPPVATPPTVNPNPQQPMGNITINNNASPQPEAKATEASKTGSQTQQNAQGATQSAGGVLPFNGSVVDLLNSAGQPSDKGSRQKLAGELGVQGYDFSAAKNTELAKKFQDFFAAKKGTKAPDNGGDVRQQMQEDFAAQGQTQEDPQKNFFDQYMEMNPVVKTLYDQINQQLSSPVKTQTFKEEFDKMNVEQGLPGLKTELMNINNIMEGTEDDIRNEITKAGGFATESQVQALKGARNKTLLRQANSLQQQIALKQDYVDQIMQFSQLDREQVEKDVDRKLGLTEKLADLSFKMEDAARDNYQKIVDKVGYTGLAQATQGDKTAQKFAEGALGLPAGSLSSSSFLASENKKEWSEPYLMGGDYVQKNEKTGEIRTAVNVAGGGSAGGGGYLGSGASTGGLSYDAGNIPFQSTIETAASLSGAAEKTHLRTQDELAALAANGDWKALLTRTQNYARKGMQAETSDDVFKAERNIKAATRMGVALQQYVDQGGDMGFFKGTADTIATKFGQLKTDPKFKALATELEAAFQVYRQDMTGAAFGANESAEYKTVVPSANKNLDLNLSVIKGLTNYLTNKVDDSYSTVLGEGYLNLKGLAQSSNVPKETSSGAPPKGVDGAAYGHPGYVSDGTQWVLR